MYIGTDDVSSAGAAHASTTDRLTLLAAWTQPTTASINAWNAARADRDRWSAYNFDWSTDYCSAAPDRPLGFNFVNACWHHDFGYRNYKDAGLFSANKAHVDDAIQDAVGQHICRCTGYVRYHRAIRQVILSTPGLVTA